MKLLIYRGDALERTIDLADRDLRIGRGVENDVVLEDPEKTVSRFHAELRYEQGAYVLFDLNSQNGTWVDGQRIQRQPLNAGQTALLGNFRIVLDAGASASAVPETGPQLAPTMMLNRDAAEPSAAPGQPGQAGASAAGASAGAQARAVATPGPSGAAAGAAAGAGARAAAPAVMPRRPKLAPATQDAKKGIASIPRPMFYGGALFFLAVIIGVMYVMRPQPPQPESEQQPPQPQQQQPAQQGQQGQAQSPSQQPGAPDGGGAAATAEPTGQETNDQIVARHVKDGRVKLDAGDVVGAIDAFNRALMIDPSNADALDLKMKAEERRHQQQQQTQTQTQTQTPSQTQSPAQTQAQTQTKTKTQTQSTRGGAPSGGGATGAGAAGAGTTSATSPAAARKARAEREVAASLQRRYTQAKSEVARGDYEHAIPDLEAILHDKPGYQDAATLLDQAKAQRHTEAQRAAAQAQTLAAKGEFTSAIRAYEQAAKIDPSTPGVQDGIAATRKQMHDAGEQAYRRARQLDAVGRTQDALPLYQRAVELLPADDPSGKAARDRLEALKSQGQDQNDGQVQP